MRGFLPRGAMFALLISAAALAPPSGPVQDASLVADEPALSSPRLAVAPLSLEFAIMKHVEGAPALVPPAEADAVAEVAAAPIAEPDPGGHAIRVPGPGGTPALMFERIADVVNVYEPPNRLLATLDAEGWASLVATMTVHGKTPQGYRSALRHFETST